MVKVKLNNYITVVKADMFNEKPGLVVYAISVSSLCYRLEGSFFSCCPDHTVYYIPFVCKVHWRKSIPKFSLLLQARAKMNIFFIHYPNSSVIGVRVIICQTAILGIVSSVLVCCFSDSIHSFHFVFTSVLPLASF